MEAKTSTKASLLIEEKNNKRNVGTFNLLLFAAGLYTDMVPNVVLGAFLQFVYTGIAPFLVATLWSSYNIIKAVAIIFIGRWVDRTSYSRRSLLLLAMLPSAIGFYFCWHVPLTLVEQKDNHIVLILYLLVFLLLFGFFHSIFHITRSTLFSELYTPKERGTIAIFQQIIMVIGVAFGMIYPPILAGENWIDRSYMALFISITFIFSYLLCLFGIWKLEDISKCDSRAKASNNNNSSGGIAAIFRNLLAPMIQHTALRSILVSCFFSQIAFSALLSTMPMFIKYNMPQMQKDYQFGIGHVDKSIELSAPASSSSSYIFATKGQIALSQAFGQVATLISSPIWIAINNKLNTKNTWRLSCIMFSSSIILFLLFEQNDFVSLLLFQIAFSAAFPPLFFLPQMAIAQISDYDAKLSKSGTSRAGIIQSTVTVLLILSSVVQATLAGNMLTSGGYDASFAEQSETAKYTIALLTFCVPIACVVISMLSIGWFNIPTDNKDKKE